MQWRDCRQPTPFPFCCCKCRSGNVFIFYSEGKKMLAHVLFLISGVTQKIPIPVVSAIWEEKKIHFTAYLCDWRITLVDSRWKVYWCFCILRTKFFHGFADAFYSNSCQNSCLVVDSGKYCYVISCIITWNTAAAVCRHVGCLVNPISADIIYMRTYHN